MEKKLLFSVAGISLCLATMFTSCGGGNQAATSEAEDSTAMVAVDLGLSVKWASCNVGANAPEEVGNYYFFGETEVIEKDTTSEGPAYGKSIAELTEAGIIDADGNLAPTFDAATVNCGEGWRTPTAAEMQELVEKCTWAEAEQNGVKGRLVTGPNGNSIFMPATGMHWHVDRYGWISEELQATLSEYGFWMGASVTENNDTVGNAIMCMFNDTIYADYSEIMHGVSVRPVKK